MYKIELILNKASNSFILYYYSFGAFMNLSEGTVREVLRSGFEII